MSETKNDDIKASEIQDDEVEKSKLENTQTNSTDEKGPSESNESPDKKEKADDKKEKADDKKKSTLITLTTRPLSEEELRNRLNKEFGRNNQYYNVLKEIVDQATDKYKVRLRNIMLLIKEGVKPDYKIVAGEVKSVEFKRKLSNEELENFVISIPVELFFIQEIMDDRALDMDLSNQLKDFHITEKILDIQGGTEKERIRAAEYNSMMPILTTIIKNRVYYNLKNEIEQASKVYDALKRVIQLRITELQTFGKSSEYGSPKHDSAPSKIDVNIEIDPRISEFVIKTRKYPDGITVKELFIKNNGYFEWIKNNTEASGNFIEYRSKVNEFSRLLENSKVRAS